jgi:hypothetical protein
MRRLKRAHQKHVREQAKSRKKFRQRTIAAGTAAIITLGTGIGLNKALGHTPDDHELPVAQDADSDLLANKEELAIGYQVFEPDQNRNEIPDGVELAKRCAAAINALPMGYRPNETYKEHLLTGISEHCDICHELISTSSWIIVNPKLGLVYPDSNDLLLDPVHLQDLMIHYMEHGSLSCAGDHSTGRVNLPKLMRVLELRYPYDPNEHQLPVDGNDLDGDLLTDTEELEAGYNLYDPDQDNDLTPDGIQLAKQCSAVISQLTFGPDPNDSNRPYIEHCPQFGIETCDICGAGVNMGPASIVNPKLNLTVDCPLIAMHYLEHGSFSHAGNVHTGRVNVAQLVKALEIPKRCGDLGTIYLPNDSNKDCRIDFVDFASFADKWLQSTEPN